jgi:hypothetical protein
VELLKDVEATMWRSIGLTEPPVRVKTSAVLVTSVEDG